jgi:hypothetical protein
LPDFLTTTCLGLLNKPPFLAQQQSIFGHYSDSISERKSSRVSQLDAITTQSGVRRRKTELDQEALVAAQAQENCESTQLAW